MAQGLEGPKTLEEIKIILDSVFLLFCAVLVIFMNAGFAMVETGFCRHKNAVNILAKNLIVFAIATIAYWAVGYGFMYGEGNSFIGTQGFFFHGDGTPMVTKTIPRRYQRPFLSYSRWPLRQQQLQLFPVR